jgi:hypothetical protein
VIPSVGDDLNGKQQKLSAADKRAIVVEARERIQDSWDHDKDNRRDAASDLRFLAGDQWPYDVRRARDAAGRPMLTINRLPQFVRQVTNDIRQADLSIKVVPEDDQSDPQLAKIFDGLIRQIQYQSSAQHVFSQAAEHQAGCGIGWFRIVTEYAQDSAFDQEIRIKAIRNPLSVYDDPAAIEPDRSDAMWRAIVEVWPQSAFKAKWPKAAEHSVDKPNDGNGNGFFWATADTIRVAEYWTKTPYDKTIALMQDGSTLDITDFNEWQLSMLPPVQKTRKQLCYKVQQYLVSGSEVLEGPHEWPGTNIPIVPVVGAEVPLDNRTFRYGVIRFAKDAQQLYNFYRTSVAEAIALQPKAPYIVTPKMIAEHKSAWDNAHRNNKPYLPYTPDDKAPGMKPQREAPPAIPAALIQEAEVASDDMKATTGIYDAALGARSNETSGIAIGRRQQDADAANYHFIDNLRRSLEYAGRMLIELIPKVYDNERVIRLMGGDDQEQFVPINKTVKGEYGEDVIINDLSVARFDVRVNIGKSFSTQRMEARESMLDFIKMLPDAAPFVIDLLAKNMDWPGADEIAKRLRQMVPPQALADPNQPPPPPPNPLDDPVVAVDVELKQAQALKLKAEAQKVISEAGAPQQQGEPPESDIDIALKHEDIIFKRAQTEKVYAEIEKIKRGEDRADSQHSTDAHFKGRQQEMAEESAAHERADGSKDPD